MRLVFIDYILHTFLPTNGKALTCLASDIRDVTVFEVGLTKMSQVDERDATEIEAHQEGVSCQFLFGCEAFGWIQTLDAADGFRWNGSLAGLGDACIYILERILLCGISFLHGFVIGGTKDTEIERAGIGTYLCHVLQVCLIGLHLLCIYLFEGNVLAISKSHIAIESSLVMLHGTILSILQQQGDEEVHELK